MTLVRVIKDWSFPDLMRQTPGLRGVWGEIRFTFESVEICDYVIVLNRVPEATTVRCPPQHIWAITQEPPVVEYRWLRQGFKHFYRVYVQDTGLKGKKYVHSQPALPWWIGKNYDELKMCSPPEKSRPLSWITSSATGRQGHRQRIEFLEQLRKEVEFDLFGKGFAPIDDKWDGLVPYRYAIAVENHRSPFYWTEKLADCLLSWTMPIYYGCTNIDDYFPPEAMVRIDITKPDEAIATIQETIQSDLWKRNRDAIAYARELILDKHQFFPFTVDLIRQFEVDHRTDPAKTVHLPELPYLYSGTSRRRKPNPVRVLLSRIKRKLLNA